MSLSDAELERYARHIVLPQVGGLGQRRLKESKVAVVGAGGIGSAVIPSLAAAGVGALTIIDFDAVEELNLQRQPLFRERDTGYSKADLALQFVQRLNRFVKAKPVQERIDATNAPRLLGDHDLVIDGSEISRPGSPSATPAWRSASAALGSRCAIPGTGRAVP